VQTRKWQWNRSFRVHEFPSNLRKKYYSAEIRASVRLTSRVITRYYKKRLRGRSGRKYHRERYTIGLVAGRSNYERSQTHICNDFSGPACRLHVLVHRNFLSFNSCRGNAVLQDAKARFKFAKHCSDLVKIPVIAKDRIVTT